MKEMIVALLKANIPGWLKFESAREKKTRAALVDLVGKANPGISVEATETLVDRHLPKILEDSLPLHELGAEALLKLSGMLRGTEGKS